MKLKKVSLDKILGKKWYIRLPVIAIISPLILYVISWIIGLFEGMGNFIATAITLMIMGILFGYTMIITGERQLLPLIPRLFVVLGFNTIIVGLFAKDWLNFGVLFTMKGFFMALTAFLLAETIAMKFLGKYLK